MEFVTFTHGGAEYAGMRCADRKSVSSFEELGLGAFPSLLSFIACAGPELLARALAASAAAGRHALDEVRLLAPIPRPAHDVICVGVNYRAHLVESEAAMGAIAHQSTVYFSKRANIVTGPDSVIDGHLDLDEGLDYEAELAVIIGRRGKNIAVEEAENYIFGYSIFNDVSARNLQKRHNQWYRGKSLDGFCVLGPTVVDRAALPFPLALDVESRVNGEVRQHSNTRMFLADVPHLLAELSQGITLEPGDIIATGTPAGVGMGFCPPKWLKSGDCVECEISGLGTLCTRIG